MNQPTTSQENINTRSANAWSRDIQREVNNEEGMNRERLQAVLSQAPAEAFGMAFADLSTRALSKESALSVASSSEPPSAQDVKTVDDYCEALGLLISKASPSERFNAATEALAKGGFKGIDSPSTLLLSGMPVDDPRLPEVISESINKSSLGLPFLLNRVEPDSEIRKKHLNAAIEQAAITHREDAFMGLMTAANYPAIDSKVAASLSAQLEDGPGYVRPSHVIVAVVAAKTALDTPEDGARVASLIKQSGLADDTPKENTSFLKDVARHVTDPVLASVIKTLEPLAIYDQGTKLMEKGAQIGMEKCCEKLLIRREDTPNLSPSSAPKI